MPCSHVALGLKLRSQRRAELLRRFAAIRRKSPQHAAHLMPHVREPMGHRPSCINGAHGAKSGQHNN